jgi:NAD(P)-dependent dehydrogenase (short-subunit alcohol dehydrogenase family)
MPPYCASKHGVIGLVRAAALDLAPHGVTVNAILPGWVRTEMSERSAAAEASRRGVSADQVWEERERSYAAGRIRPPPRWPKRLRGSVRRRPPRSAGRRSRSRSATPGSAAQAA